MANEVASIRYVARPITIDDGEYRHELKPGMFVPDRFPLQADPESGKLVARHGALRPWGSGTAMCKGRTFAERQLWLWRRLSLVFRILARLAVCRSCCYGARDRGQEAR